jgi:hypothetical protein
LIRKNPNDTVISTLHVLRIGFYAKVDRGGIALDRAAEIFLSAIEKKKAAQTVNEPPPKRKLEVFT